MSEKFYPIVGEGQKLNTKLQQISKNSTAGTPVYIPELRMTVYTKAKETPEQTKKRYLKKTISFKNVK